MADAKRLEASARTRESAFESAEASAIQEENLPRELDAALGDVLPPEKKSEVVARVKSILVAHSGPLPPASELARYEDVLPRGAERIFAMAEKQQDHANLVERRSLSAEIALSALGQILGWSGLIGITGAGLAVVYFGHVAAGAGIIAATSVAAIAPHLIKGRSILFGSPVSQTTSNKPPTPRVTKGKPRRR